MATDKFKELILYVAEESASDPNFGATKLNKVLFFADFLHYRTTGASISGQAYFKLAHGPAPRALKPALAEMIAEGHCVVESRPHHKREQKRVVCQRAARRNLFSAEELETIARVLAALRSKNASQVSDLSHRFIGWKAAGPQENIPYETVYLGDPAELVLSEEDILYGQQLARELGVGLEGSVQ
jgi:Protein of unknown function (DUF4065)